MNREPTENRTEHPALDETIAQDSGNDTNSDGDFSTDEVPETLGRYKIEKLLGRGGMGAVYLAHDSQLDRDIALKIPKFGSNANPKLITRFYREARSAATLTHPNLCPVYDVGEIDGTHYIAMAYIQGRTLSSYVNPEAPPSQRIIAVIVRKVALAMEEAHRSGIIHRDLKPANIMIDQRKEPIVMDFGLACPQDMGDDSRLTQDGALLGSPAYMSPEQLKGQLDAIGKSSDVYSLGVVLYELLTGTLPFDGSGSTIAMIGKILTEEPADPATLRNDLDPAMVSICRKSIAKDPSQRYASMLDFANDLARFIKSSSGDAGTLGEPQVRAADVTRIQLTEQSRLAKTLCETGQFVAAVPVLQQIVSNQKGQETKMVAWAKTMLPKVKARVAADSKAKTAAAQPLGDDLFGNLPAAAAPAVTLQSFPPRPVNRATSKGAIPPLVWIIPSALVGVVLVGIGAMLFFQGPGDPPPEPPPANFGTASTSTTSPDTSSSASSSAPIETAENRGTDSTAARGPKGGRLLRPGAPAEEVFAAFDKNEDGYLVSPEIPEPERMRMMDADADGDGRVSMSELKSVKPLKEHRDFSPLDRPGEGRLDDLMSFDTNQDGKVSASELPLRSRFLMERADRNEDGFLDQTEIDEIKRRAESGRGRPFDRESDADRPFRPGGPGKNGPGRPNGPGGRSGPPPE